MAGSPVLYGVQSRRGTRALLFRRYHVRRYPVVFPLYALTEGSTVRNGGFPARLFSRRYLDTTWLPSFRRVRGGKSHFSVCPYCTTFEAVCQGVLQKFLKKIFAGLRLTLAPAPFPVGGIQAVRFIAPLLYHTFAGLSRGFAKVFEKILRGCG